MAAIKVSIKFDLYKVGGIDGTAIYHELNYTTDEAGKEYLKSCLKSTDQFICLDGSYINKSHIVKIDFN